MSLVAWPTSKRPGLLLRSVLALFVLASQIRGLASTPGDSTAGSAQTSGSVALQPGLLWAQRRTVLYLFVQIPDVTPTSVQVDLTDRTLSFAASSASGLTYKLDVEFFRRLESRTASWHVVEKGELSGVQLILPKFWEWKYWPRLHRAPTSKLKVAVDWRRWKRDEVDDALTKIPDGEDAGWWDEEIAAAKPVLFTDDDAPYHLLPLLNATSFQDFVSQDGVTAVLFFDRLIDAKYKETRSTMKVFAALAGVLDPVKVRVACVDMQDSYLLAAKLHVRRPNSVELFFPDGTALPVNLKALSTASQFVQYLQYQLQPAVAVVDSTESAAKALAELHKVLVHVHDEETSEAEYDTFDLIAKKWRADSIGLRMRAVRISTAMVSELKAMAAETESPEPWLRAAGDAFKEEDVPQNFTGIVMIKMMEPLVVYDGPPDNDALWLWTVTHQLSAIEPMSKGALQYVRSFRRPVLYVFLGEGGLREAEVDGTLAQLRDLATAYKRDMFFMWGVANVHTTVMQYLGCKYHGVAFAVLEDIQEDYKYCLESNEAKPLTLGRVRTLLDRYIRREVKPDVYASEAVPAKDEGPLHKVVSRNLMQTVMDPAKDVVLHIYSEEEGADEWKHASYVLERVATDLEDVESLYIAHLNGDRNQPEPDFPELGYIPCTWIFPADSKSRPLLFNATLGVSYERLVTWIHKSVDRKFELDDEMVEKRLADLGPYGLATDGVSFDDLERLHEEDKRRKRKRKRRKSDEGPDVLEPVSHGLDFGGGVEQLEVKGGSAHDAGGSQHSEL